eukprot:4410216-Amphidinium_carterae.1
MATRAETIFEPDLMTRWKNRRRLQCRTVLNGAVFRPVVRMSKSLVLGLIEVAATSQPNK